MNTPQHISDRYELGETLGFGGMSEVHQARDLRLHRDVAIKVLRADLARDPSFYLRFRREAQNAAALNHPTIVAVYDSGEAETESGPLPYIVMEYVDGETLRDVLRREGKVAPRQAMLWVADVAAALEFSHQNGIVHRDVKPANVMIDHAGAVKVMDFGIARAMADGANTMTQTAAVIGTAQYLSPEQARGASVDARSDVYSLGCVLFELLTGQPPFTGDSPVAVAYQHVREDPPTPSSIDPEIPRELDSVVLKAMAKNPDNRYQSAADLRSELVKVLAGGKPSAPIVMTDADRTELIDTPVRARSVRVPGTADTARRDPRRRRLIGAIIAVIALVILSVLLISKPWSSGSQVTVNPVAGDSEANARASLVAQGFRVDGTIIDENSNTVAPGLITRSDPSQGTKASKGSTIQLFRSIGAKSVQVPDLKGKTPDDAVNQLKNMGFASPAPVTVASDPNMKGKVVGTDPPAGTTLALNQPIRVQVGGGPLKVSVPDLTGQTVDAAQTNLDQLKLKMQEVDVDSMLPAGQIVSWTPGTGNQVDQGSTVDVDVSRGNQFRMPDLRGMTQDQATQTLAGLGYKVALTANSANLGLGNPGIGKVVNQSSPPGSVVKDTDPITVAIGQLTLLPGG